MLVLVIEILSDLEREKMCIYLDLSEYWEFFFFFSSIPYISQFELLITLLDFWEFVNWEKQVHSWKFGNKNIIVIFS